MLRWPTLAVWLPGCQAPMADPPAQYRMPTVAIIGPDGAGKTTVASRVAQFLQEPVRYIYMGWNHDASNVLLPTNRLARYIRHRFGRAAHGEPARRKAVPVVAQLAAGFKLVNLIAEGWYRQIVARRAAARGNLVIFDRHPIADYPDSYETASIRPLRRLRHAVLRRALPRPQILIYLDAPAEVLLQRKGEGTLESLNRQRAIYRRLVEGYPRGAVVDADRDLEIVTRDVATAIDRFIVRPGR